MLTIDFCSCLSDGLWTRSRLWTLFSVALLKGLVPQRQKSKGRKRKTLDVKRFRINEVVRQ